MTTRTHGATPARDEVDAQEVDPRNDARRSLGRVIFRNSAVATVGNLAIRLSNLAYTVYVIRTLGNYEWGQYATAGSIVAVTSVFFELGLAQYTQREIAKSASRSNDLFW